MRSAAASETIAAADGRIWRPRKFAGIVVVGVDDVEIPRMPTLVPSTSTTIDAFAQSMRVPASSAMFAASTANFASPMRALSAPRGSSPCFAVTSGPTGP